MSTSRLPSRLLVVALALLRLPARLRRNRPVEVRRILIAHHLLLGDTLMLTPLLAKLRERYPLAEVVMPVRKDLYPLYQTSPYGVHAVAYDPRDIKTLLALLRQPGFDLALLPADNRFSWLAFALGSRWIVGFEGDRPAYKNWLVDELRPNPADPMAWCDTTAELVDGPRPQHYEQKAWPAPAHRKFEYPVAPYCVLHVGASMPLKLWQPERWRQLAAWLETHGNKVVLSAGAREKHIIDGIDPHGRYQHYAGALDLAQLWHLLAGARLLVTIDTGIAHLGRVVNVPTVTLFGPGSAVLCGAGDFWRDSPYRAVTVDPFPCRDQRTNFVRVIDWVRRCERFPGSGPNQCPEAKCMQAISLDAVQSAVQKLLAP